MKTTSFLRQAITASTLLFAVTSVTVVRLGGCKKVTPIDSNIAVTNTSTLTTGAASQSSGDKATDDKADDAACFPGDAVVLMESGVSKKMEDLAVDDRVSSGSGKFSGVFMFTHKLQNSQNVFVQLETASGKALKLTAGHYLYVNGNLAQAKTARIGDTLELAGGEPDAVTRVSKVNAGGLYNPQTVNGNILVNEIVASTYTTAVEPVFAHAILSPLRALNRLGLSFSALEDRSHLAKWLPTGGNEL